VNVVAIAVVDARESESTGIPEITKPVAQAD
jgi:hypothetical protein